MLLNEAGVEIYCFRYLTHVIDSNPHIYFLADMLPLLGNFPLIIFCSTILYKLCKSFVFVCSKATAQFSRRVAVQAFRM